MIQPPHRSFALLRPNLTADSDFEGWMREVSNALNAMIPTEGSGSPEGVLTAPRFAYYFDTVGENMYQKMTDGTVNTGWKIIT